MPAPKSDPQQDKLYWLEAEINGTWNIDSSRKSSLLYVLDKVSRYYKVDPPKLKVVNRCGKNDNAGWWEDGMIYLNRGKGGANMHTLLHEFSHHLVDEFYENAEHHGPEFVALYMHLLDKYCILPHECFRMLARKHRLRIARKYRPKAFR